MTAMAKLVVCFSLTGNTRLIAKTIAKEAGADFTELVPVRQYPLRGAWLYLRGGKEAVFKSEPELERGIVDYDDYDMMVVGTPVWAGTMAPPIRTFLKSLAVKGKKIYVFCTYGGGPGTSLQDMRDISLGDVVGELGVRMGSRFVTDSVNKAKTFALQLGEN